MICVHGVLIPVRLSTASGYLRFCACAFVYLNRARKFSPKYDGRANNVTSITTSLMKFGSSDLKQNYLLFQTNSQTNLMSVLSQTN